MYEAHTFEPTGMFKKMFQYRLHHVVDHVLNEIIQQETHVTEIGACPEPRCIKARGHCANQPLKLPGDQVLKNRLLKMSAVRDPRFRFDRDLLVMRAEAFESPTERDYIAEVEGIGSLHCVESTQK
jgi:hypothetical protein